ncbi:hypothetical protein FRC98_00820 [Lujinxingia vulgaris]|uniref:PhnA-like protein n=1 Tax=Lujinxingia vulgaris TaxID=2600176 RepID=A0A5C6XAP3_9DELT|nr:hypothetical protein [Lujinxingia vulgaris]TXD38976.1 hypothetical protein FRC98_00820 [Lujinxingia vulgaris]
MANKEQGSREYRNEPVTGAHAYGEEIVMEGGAFVDRPISQISWGAIVAGVFVTFVVLTLLNVLGLAIGAVVFDAYQPNQGGELGLGAAIWWTVSALLALFAGGWVTGRMSGVHHRQESLLHGIVTWAVTVTALLLAVSTVFGQLVGGAFGFLGSTASSAAGAPGWLNQIQGAAGELGLTAEQLSQLQADALMAGQEASTAMAAASFWAFVAILLGALACAFGSALASSSLSEEEFYERGGAKAHRRLRTREV